MCACLFATVCRNVARARAPFGVACTACHVPDPRPLPPPFPSLQFPRYFRVNTLKARDEETVAALSQLPDGKGGTVVVTADPHIEHVWQVPGSLDLHAHPLVVSSAIILQVMATAGRGGCAGPPPRCSRAALAAVGLSAPRWKRVRESRGRGLRTCGQRTVLPVFRM
jgi:hypothetical protein